jgi:uncharacterized protein (DUF427 family)
MLRVSRRLEPFRDVHSQEKTVPVAEWNGVVIATSDATVVVVGNHYFPRSSVDERVLRPSATTSRCPWKGEAHYVSLEVAGATNTDAAWYYPEPLPAAAEIAGHLAFWHGVTVKE